MNKQGTIKEHIRGILNTSDFGVLATEGNGQPHASLIAITPFGNFPHLIFATYRNTFKYRNLSHNNKVAVLIERETVNMKGLKETVVLTIIGYTEEVRIEEKKAASHTHLKRHPEMKSFMRSPDCVLIRVVAQSYQLVYGIDEIKWITANDLDSHEKAQLDINY